MDWLVRFERANRPALVAPYYWHRAIEHKQSFVPEVPMGAASAEYGMLTVWIPLAHVGALVVRQKSR